MSSSKNKIIFLVDDDRLTNFVNKRIMLKSGFNIDIHTFDCPDNALIALSELSKSDLGALPDVILLDINMPLLDGWDFLREYEKMFPNSESKIYMLSSSLNDEDINMAAKFRMVTGFISKPLKSDQLYEILEAMVLAA